MTDHLTPPAPQPEPAAPVAPGPPRASELATSAAAWLRQLARAAKISRLYRVGNPIAEETRRNVWEKLGEITERHGTFAMRFTPTEVFVGDECIIKPARDADPEAALARAGEEQLPMLFHGDGIRALTFTPGVPRGEVEALVDALRDSGTTMERHDDLVTLLWQANLSSIRVTAAPPEQTIYHSSRANARARGAGYKGPSYHAGGGSELRADLGQGAGAQGLHRDRFDDRVLPLEEVDVISAYADLEITSSVSRARLLDAWEVEVAREDDPMEIARFLRSLVDLDRGDGMRDAVANLTVSWLPSAMGRAAWNEAKRALDLLFEIRPYEAAREEPLTLALRRVDATALAEKLERSEKDDLASFLSLAIEIGPSATTLVCDIMAAAEETATRAAAGVALASMCAAKPERLRSYLSDPRWYVVRNTATVLGMIGGTGVAELLRPALSHPDPRVVREAIRSLARTPRDESALILVELLGSRDTKVLSTALSVVTREKSPEMARALLARIESTTFENEPEELQRAAFSALAEIADDSVVPGLAALLHRGGLFVRRSFVKVAAARTLARIGTDTAREALEGGMKSKHEAVRSICREALGSLGRKS
jgi:HEAT repeat protein